MSDPSRPTNCFSYTDLAFALGIGQSCTVEVSMTGEATGHYKGTFSLLWGCCHGIPDTVIPVSGTVRPG